MIAKYHRNKPLMNSIFMGFIYFIFCWSIDISEVFKGLFAITMLFLPGLTFPFTTSYFSINSLKYERARLIVHSVFSVGIYFGAVWLFTGEGRIKYTTVLAGFLGSLLYLLLTKFVLNKALPYLLILLVALLSAFAFLLYESLGRHGIYLGIALLSWTLINGWLLNWEYRSKIIKQTT